MGWDSITLSESLSATGVYQATPITDTSLIVCSKSLNAPLVISIKGDYMNVEAKLFDETEIDDLDKINESLLMATDLLHLSSFTIRICEGKKVYFILGEMSSQSSIKDVELEINTLNQNMTEVINMVLSVFLDKNISQEKETILEVK